MESGILRIEPESFSVLGLRDRVLPRSLQCNGQVVTHTRRVGTQPHRLPVVPNGLIVIVLLLQEAAQIVVGTGHPWLVLNGAPIAGRRCVRVAEFPDRKTQVEMMGGVPWLEVDGDLQAFHGVLRIGDSKPRMDELAKYSTVGD